MTCGQSYPSEASMERIRNNLASFTEKEAQLQHQPTSMRDYKNLKMSFKTRVKILFK
jgi:hypothetical protein